MRIIVLSIIRRLAPGSDADSSGRIIQYYLNLDCSGIIGNGSQDTMPYVPHNMPEQAN